MEAETAAEEVRAAGWDRLSEGRVCWDPHLPALAAEELARVLDDLLVRQEAVGLLLAQHKHLPQRHPERPHVTGRGELALWTERICSGAWSVKSFQSAPSAAQHEDASGEMLQKEPEVTAHTQVPQALRRNSVHRGKAL